MSRDPLRLIAAFQNLIMNEVKALNLIRVQASLKPATLLIPDRSTVGLPIERVFDELIEQADMNIESLEIDKQEPGADLALLQILQHTLRGHKATLKEGLESVRRDKSNDAFAATEI